MDIKAGCVCAMVIGSILPQVEFGRNDHREDTPHFTRCFKIILQKVERFVFKFFRQDSFKNKQGCILSMAVVSVLPHTEFRQNDHREDASHFTRR